jgi:hypothetical protein
MIQMMVNDKLLLNDKGEVIKPGEYEGSRQDYFDYSLTGLTASALSGAAAGSPALGIGAVPGAAVGVATYIIGTPIANLIGSMFSGAGTEDVTYVNGEKTRFGNTKSTREAIDDLQKYALELQEKNLIKTPLYGYTGGGAGKFTMNSGRIKVMPGAYGTDNFIRYAQLNNTLKNLAFTKDNARASVTGITANDWNKATDEKLNMVAQNIIADLYEYSKNKKNKDGAFNLDFHPIANDSLDFAGVTIKVPEKIAEKYKMKNEGKSNQSGYLSAEVYDKLIANGLTIIGKSSNFVGTDLYNNAFIDPVESRVRAQYAIDKSGVTYANPYYDGYSISFTQLDGGQIQYEQTVPMWDPNRNAYVSVKAGDILSGQGLQLQNFRNNFWGQVASMNEQNNR